MSCRRQLKARPRESAVSPKRGVLPCAPKKRHNKSRRVYKKKSKTKAQIRQFNGLCEKAACGKVRKKTANLKPPTCVLSPSGRLRKGLVSRFAPQSVLLAPSSAPAAAFNLPDFSPTTPNAALRTARARSFRRSRNERGGRQAARRLELPAAAQGSPAPPPLHTTKRRRTSILRRRFVYSSRSIIFALAR